MAVTFTRNLKLKIDSNLTANAKYNLERIDLLGSTFLVDSTDALNVRSRTDINIEPESADIDGSGLGGVVNVGSSSHEIDEFNIYSTDVNFSDAIGLKDQATSGTKYLRFKYKSDLNGSLDTTADRSLSVDLDGADRQLVLGGNLMITGGNLVMTLTGNSSVTLPLTGTLATLAGVETLTNKTIDADSNSISNIRNANVAANAAIAYSKLALTNSIVNADVASGAGILYSKLSLGDSIVNADINAAAAIAYSKLNLASSIVNADISASAAIAGSKISPDFGSQVVRTEDRFRLDGGSYNTDLLPASAGQAADLEFRLPPNYGTSGQFLRTDGSGNLTWATASGGGGGDLTGYAQDWDNADGVSLVVTHSLNSTDVDVTIIDLDDDSIVHISDIVITDANTVTLTASEAPATSWRVIVQANS